LRSEEADRREAGPAAAKQFLAFCVERLTVLRGEHEPVHLTAA